MDSRDRFVSRVAKLIENNHGKDGDSFIFGLSGKWGVGKTFFLKQLAEKLEKNDKYVVVWISPWKYGADTTIFLRNFLQSIADTLKNKQNLWGKLVHHLSIKPQIKLLEKDRSSVQFRWWVLFVLIAVASLYFLYQQFAPDAFVFKVNTDLIVLKTIIVSGASLILIPLLSKLITIQTTNKAVDTLDGFDRILDTIVKKQKNKEIVVFVDDLDRVSPSTARSVLDTLRTFFDKNHISFVVTGDHTVLERHIGAQILPKNSQAEQLEEGRRYLKKVFNIYWQLPVPTNKEFDKSLDEYFKEKDAHLTKFVFSTAQSDQKDIFKSWVSMYFDKNFRNVHRFVETVIFNFGVIQTQIDASEGEDKEQLIALRENPLLVIRILMIQEFSAPLFDEFVRKPSLVAELDQNISKNGDLLESTIKALKEQNKLSPSQENFMRSFMREVPRFYDPEKGGIVVYSTQPFIFMAGSSEFSDSRGPTTDDFKKMVTNENKEAVKASLQTSGPDRVKEITKNLLGQLEQLKTQDVNKMIASISVVTDALIEIDSDHSIHDTFLKFFSQLDISQLMTTSQPVDVRMRIVTSFYIWLDSLSEEKAFTHYYQKLMIHDARERDLVEKFVTETAKLGHFSLRLVSKWLAFLYPHDPARAMQFIEKNMEAITKHTADEFKDQKDRIINDMLATPSNDLSKKLWAFIYQWNNDEVNEALKARILAQISANHREIAGWVADNKEKLGELFDYQSILDAYLNELVTKFTPTAVNTLVDSVNLHARIAVEIKDEFWKRIMSLDEQAIVSGINSILDGNMRISVIAPNTTVSEILMEKVIVDATQFDDQNEANRLRKLSKDHHLWSNNLQLPSKIGKKIRPKTRAESKPHTKQAVLDVLNSWQQP